MTGIDSTNGITLDSGGERQHQITSNADNSRCKVGISKSDWRAMCNFPASSEIPLFLEIAGGEMKTISNASALDAGFPLLRTKPGFNRRRHLDAVLMFRLF